MSIHICLHNTLTFNFGQTGLVWFCGLSKPTEREQVPVMLFKRLVIFGGGAGFPYQKVHFSARSNLLKEAFVISPPKTTSQCDE